MSLSETAPIAQSVTAPKMSIRRVSLLGALFIATGPIAMALYTPAMAEVVAAYGTTNSLVKMTLTLYFAGFATAQLIAGPVSDALGRKPVIISFMLLFVAASLLALIAPTIETLIAARFMQGVGASAGVAISRALVRDLFEGDESSRIMNLMGIILAVAPAMAPALGGMAVTHAGWRSVFALMMLFGLVVVSFSIWSLRETIVPDRSRLNLRALGRSYLTLAGNRHFMTSSLTIAGSIGAIYALATVLPFILMQKLGLSPTAFGLWMLSQSGSFFLGSLLVRQLMKRYSAYDLVAPGLGVILLGSALIFSLLFGAPSVLRVMLPVAVYTFGIAFVMPAMSTAALAPFPRIAGAASSLMGFLQMGAGLLVGSIAALFDNPVVALAILIPTMGVVASLSYALYRSAPHLAEPEPRKDVISGPPAGRSWVPSDKD
ncbi:multidrug effflux MFS transporter [Sulfitobacter delicatus]|uniref:Bcr/CflA family efflux transporter n=1 Tax=Sulfitobacter delicatus TaxID=218672 RepID=A0A1G7R8N2_9RHOB|nr:multidrug effflux MFS transporter [Sulfitobacter delicatus]SDG06350.1 MFS transporter, DHA1 family, bicyclomycin/chloramphenicol resistance protein [Sulfitobacter delicatus]